MLKTTLITAVVLTAFAAPVAAEDLVRGHIDNAINGIQSFLGDDSPEHQARQLTDRIRLLDTEMETMVSVFEQKRIEREEAAQALTAMGGTAPPAKFSAPATLPKGDGTEMQCITSLSGVPIHCW